MKHQSSAQPGLACMIGMHLAYFKRQAMNNWRHTLRMARRTGMSSIKCNTGRLAAVLSAGYIGMLLLSTTAHAQGSAADKSNIPEVMKKSMQEGAKNSPDASGTATGKVSNADSSLMRNLAQMHLAESKMAGLAQSISQSPEVHSFAQRMLDEHIQALHELRQLATAKGVILPGGPEKEHAAILNQLALLTGEDFNQQYMAHAGVNAHQQGLRLMQEAQARARDPQLQAYVAKYLPVIERHWQMSQQVQQSQQPAQPQQGLPAAQTPQPAVKPVR
jgi:putative membrane protein